MCNVEELLKLTIFGAGVACAGSLMAEEKIPATESGNFSWMQQYKVSDGQEGNAFREEVEMRMRNMSLQEQDLMRNTEVSGRDRVTSGNKAKSSDFEQTHGNFGVDSTYGQGFESRQLQQTRPDPMYGGSDIGRGAGSIGRQGRGR
jgi:hypothetical protein